MMPLENPNAGSQILGTSAIASHVLKLIKMKNITGFVVFLLTLFTVFWLFVSGSGLRKSGGKGKKQSKESMRASLDSRLVHTLWTRPGLDCVDLVFTLVWFSRGSAELLEEPGVRVSPSESMTSIPTCMPFSWFGEKDRDRDRDPSSSSSSLPYTATDASEHSHNSKNKVLCLHEVGYNHKKYICLSFEYYSEFLNPCCSWTYEWYLLEYTPC